MPRPMPIPAFEQKSAIGPWSLSVVVDQRLYVGFFADIDLPARPADLPGNGRSTFTVEIRHRDMRGTFRRKPTRHRTPDPTRAASNNDDLVLDSHCFRSPNRAINLRRFAERFPIQRTSIRQVLLERHR